MASAGGATANTAHSIRSSCRPILSACSSIMLYLCSWLIPEVFRGICGTWLPIQQLSAERNTEFPAEHSDFFRRCLRLFDRSVEETKSEVVMETSRLCHLLSLRAFK